MKSIFKKALPVLIATGALSLVHSFTSQKAQAAYINGIYQIVLEAAPSGADKFCIDVDSSKVGVLPGAEKLKVLPCQNIREQRWKIDQTNGKNYFESETPVNGQKVCIAIDGSKIGVVLDANRAKVEPCRYIRELAFSTPSMGNGKVLPQPNVPDANGQAICLAVDGSKIGVLPDANKVVGAGCQNIREYRWKFNYLGALWATPTTPVAPAPTVQPAPTPSPTPIIDSIEVPINTLGPHARYYDLEVWLVARRRTEQNATAILESDVGHAFIGVVGRNLNTGEWTALRTYSYWPNSNLSINHNTDYSNLQKLLRGEQISPRGHQVRKSRVSGNRALWIMNTEYKNSSCANYRFFGGISYCNCMDYSTRLWKNLTSNWENFEFSNFQYTPDQLYDKMRDYTNTKGTDFVDNGKRWQ